MASDIIEYDIEKGIATITLIRPDVPNALNQRLGNELIDALHHAEANAHVLILTREGSAFCAGGDLWSESLADLSHSNHEAIIQQLMVEIFNPIISRVANLQISTLSAINGLASRGGVGLARASDNVIARKSTTFTLGFAKDLGVIPDLGATWFLPRFVGRARAIGIAYSGEPLSADEAEAIALIWKSVPDKAFDGLVSDTAKKLSRGRTEIQSVIRRAFDRSMTHSIDEQLA